MGDETPTLSVEIIINGIINCKRDMEETMEVIYETPTL